MSQAAAGRGSKAAAHRGGGAATDSCARTCLSSSGTGRVDWAGEALDLVAIERLRRVLWRPQLRARVIVAHRPPDAGLQGQPRRAQTKGAAAAAPIAAC